MEEVTNLFGPPTSNLMVLYSNAQIGCSGWLLPHFTPFPTLGSHWVNVFAQDVANQDNADVFQPVILVGPLLVFSARQWDSKTVSSPILVASYSSKGISFCCPGPQGWSWYHVIFIFTPHFFHSSFTLGLDVCAFRINRSLLCTCLDSLGYLNDADFNFCQKCGFRQFCSVSQHSYKQLKTTFKQSMIVWYIWLKQSLARVMNVRSLLFTRNL